MRKILCDHCGRDLTNSTFYAVELHILSSAKTLGSPDGVKTGPIVRELCEWCRNRVKSALVEAPPRYAPAEVTA